MSDPSGNRMSNGAQQSNSTPISRLKLRTASARRAISAFSNSPTRDGRIIRVEGMINVGRRPSPDRGIAMIAERKTIVQNMDTTCGVVGKLILLMKLKALMVPATPPGR